jgi:hypothetical protein
LGNVADTLSPLDKLDNVLYLLFEPLEIVDKALLEFDLQD